MLFIPVLITAILLVVSAQQREDELLTAEGNYAVILETKSARSTETGPQKDRVEDLWCQTRRNHEKHILTIQHAFFIRTADHEKIPARLERNGTRAILELGILPVTRAGKYRCEIITTHGHRVHGNLFVNMRPVFHSNDSRQRLDARDDDPFVVDAASSKAIIGQPVTLHCPVIGYPSPKVQWFKDGVPVNISNRLIISGSSQLHIIETVYEDEGLYSCVATNHFPIVVDGESQMWQAVLWQQLRIAGANAWIYPLIVIIITLALLLLVIYGSEAIKRRREERDKNRILLKTTDGKHYGDEDGGGDN